MLPSRLMPPGSLSCAVQSSPSRTSGPCTCGGEVGGARVRRRPHSCGGAGRQAPCPCSRHLSAARRCADHTDPARQPKPTSMEVSRASGHWAQPGALLFRHACRTMHWRSASCRASVPSDRRVVTHDKGVVSLLGTLKCYKQVIPDRQDSAGNRRASETFMEPAGNTWRRQPPGLLEQQLSI